MKCPKLREIYREAWLGKDGPELQQLGVTKTARSVRFYQALAKSVNGKRM